MVPFCVPLVVIKAFRVRPQAAHIITSFSCCWSLQWDHNPAIAITVSSPVMWFYKSNTVLSLQEQQQQEDRLQIAMLAEVNKYPVVC